jgi:glutaredoxin
MQPNSQIPSMFVFSPESCKHCTDTPRVLEVCFDKALFLCSHLRTVAIPWDSSLPRPFVPSLNPSLEFVRTSIDARLTTVPEALNELGLRGILTRWQMNQNACADNGSCAKIPQAANSLGQEMSGVCLADPKVH